MCAYVCTQARICVCGMCVMCVCVHDMFVHVVGGVGGMYMRYLCICMYRHRKSPGVHEGIAFSRGNEDARGDAFIFSKPRPRRGQSSVFQASP